MSLLIHVSGGSLWGAMHVFLGWALGYWTHTCYVISGVRILIAAVQMSFTTGLCIVATDPFLATLRMTMLYSVPGQYHD